MGNKLSTSQFLLLSAVLIVTFKLNTFASIIYNGYNSSTVLVFVMYLILDILFCIFVYKLCKNDFFNSLSNKRRVILSLSLTVFLVVKLIVYFSEQANFVKNYLVQDMPFWLIYIVLIVTTLVFSRFRMNSLARTCEIVMPVISMLLLLNLVFLRVDLSFNYNLPLISENTKGYNGIFSYFAWSFDVLPLVVCSIKDRSEEKRKKKFFGIMCLILGIVFSIMIVVFGISIYGGAFKMVDNLYVKISIFNDYNLLFGRTDWIGITCWTIASFVVCSANVIALKQATQIMTKTRRNTSIFSLVILYFLLIFYLNDIRIVDKFAVEYFGYICFYSLMIFMFLVIFLQIWGQNGKKNIKK